MATPTLATVGGTEFSVGYQGQIAYDPANADIESRLNENAAAIDFGAPVQAGAAVSPGTVGNCAPSANGGTVLGFAVRLDSEANAPQAAGTTAVVNYAQNKMVPIMRKGWMWCLAAENATAQDGVVGVVAGNGCGSITGGAVGAGRLATPGVWQQTVTAANIGLVRVN